jgi:hypothetical protein
MKAQREGGDGPPGGGNPASSQIADDDTAPGDAIQLGDDSNGLLVIEMVQYLGAKNEVYAPVRKGERERIAADGHVHSVARRGEQVEGAIEGDRSEREAAAARELARPPGEISESGADVQQGRLCDIGAPELIEEGTKREHNGTSTPQQHVRAFDVPMRSLAQDWIDIWIVEDFERRGSHRSSWA